MLMGVEDEYLVGRMVDRLTSRCNPEETLALLHPTHQLWLRLTRDVGVRETVQKIDQKSI